MNRGIKFRGWHLLEKRWVYGGVHIIADQAQIIEERRGVQNFHSEVDRESIGQYTGLKDKNGVEIYKGDVVHSAYHDTYSEIRFGIFNDPDDDGDDLGNGFYFFAARRKDPVNLYCSGTIAALVGECTISVERD